MKRMCSFVLALMLLLCMLPASAIHAADGGRILVGDIDLDGTVDSNDYLILKRSFLETLPYELNETQRIAADFNGDGEIDSVDYLALKRAFLEDTLEPTYRDPITPPPVGPETGDFTLTREDAVYEVYSPKKISFHSENNACSVAFFGSIFSIDVLADGDAALTATAHTADGIALIKNNDISIKAVQSRPVYQTEAPIFTLQMDLGKAISFDTAYVAVYQEVQAFVGAPGYGVVLIEASENGTDWETVGENDGWYCMEVATERYSETTPAHVTECILPLGETVCAQYVRYSFTFDEAYADDHWALTYSNMYEWVGLTELGVAKQTAGEPGCVHLFLPASCYYPKTCLLCEREVGSPAGHILDFNGTCTVCGWPDDGRDDPELPYSPLYVAWSSAAYPNTIGKGGLVNRTPYDGDVLPVHDLNTPPVEGWDSNIAYNSAYGANVTDGGGDFSGHVLYTFTYDPAHYNYRLTGVTDGANGAAIPKEGFVVAVLKYLDEGMNLPKDANYYPFGFRGSSAPDATVFKKTPTVDGVVSEAEYGKPIWVLDPEHPYLCSYEQLQDADFSISAKVYMTYDEKNLYLAVTVDTAHHSAIPSLNDPSGMWRYTCIQVNVTPLDPTSPFASVFWDHNGATEPSSPLYDPQSALASINLIRQFGFALNDKGDVVSCVWIGNTEFPAYTGNAVITRDNAAKQTVYEIAIPWAECGSCVVLEELEELKAMLPELGELYDTMGLTPKVNPVSGTTLGVSVSVNCGDGNFRNLFLRDGGGIIGRNDWTKIPVITLG